MITLKLTKFEITILELALDDYLKTHPSNDTLTRIVALLREETR